MSPLAKSVSGDSHLNILAETRKLGHLAIFSHQAETLCGYGPAWLKTARAPTIGEEVFVREENKAKSRKNVSTEMQSSPLRTIPDLFAPCLRHFCNSTQSYTRLKYVSTASSAFMHQLLQHLVSTLFGGTSAVLPGTTSNTRTKCRNMH